MFIVILPPHLILNYSPCPTLFTLFPPQPSPLLQCPLHLPVQIRYSHVHKVFSKPPGDSLFCLLCHPPPFPGIRSHLCHSSNLSGTERAVHTSVPLAEKDSSKGSILILFLGFPQHPVQSMARCRYSINVEI